MPSTLPYKMDHHVSIHGRRPSHKMWSLQKVRHLHTQTDSFPTKHVENMEKAPNPLTFEVSEFVYGHTTLNVPSLI